jgi:hypothetical protein
MFIPSMFLEDPHDPFKRPDRRWLRCCYLVEHGRSPSVKRDDTSTWRGWRYLRGLQKCQDDADRQRLDQDYPDVAAARSLHDDAGPLRRAELEARLLGRASDDEIAVKMGLTPAAVGVYHDLFFDVRPKLAASTYISLTVLGPKFYDGTLRQDDHELLLKAAGYAYGGHGVDALLDYLRDPPVVPADLSGLNQEQLQTLGDKLRIKLWVLSLTTSASAASPETWRWLQRRHAEAVGRRAAEGERAVLGALKPVLDLMDALGRGEHVQLPRAEAVPA